MLSLNKKELVLRNLCIVNHFVSKFYIDDFDLNYDLLVSKGITGLLSCADEYNEKNGVKFSSFASNKIKTEILNEIRRTSSYTKDDVLYVKNYCDNILSTIRNNSDINTCLDINDFSSIFDLNMKNKCLLAFSAFLDDFLLDSEDIQLNSLINLQKDICMLSCLEKNVLYLYYKEELNYNQISSILNTSNNYVFMIHTIGISKIRELLNKK